MGLWCLGALLNATPRQSPRFVALLLHRAHVLAHSRAGSFGAQHLPRQLGACLAPVLWHLLGPPSSDGDVADTLGAFPERGGAPLAVCFRQFPSSRLPNHPSY
eukprot:scaffold7053_cov380-Pinguiococcus_pyrenoidosus.AAC.1